MILNAYTITNVLIFSLDANECNNYNICNGQPCLNIVGNYRCSCGAGYLTTEQNKECEGKEQSLVYTYQAI